MTRLLLFENKFFPAAIAITDNVGKCNTSKKQMDSYVSILLIFPVSFFEMPCPRQQEIIQ